ncbi:MAG TPA: Ig-like domain repeat protein [Candidatus Sulfotelmatobacter sp.]|nr:Ig-like domain repeat protein [Candidatus Sulfotelmatobacter sp.]
MTVLKGNVHPLARPQFDLGAADPSLPMSRMLLVLKRSGDQESALEKLLDDQQDKSSPSYHKWMTPEQFGAQFGPTDDDLQTIQSWLQSHGFQVGSTKGRTVLEFSGTAGQVQEAFHTTIHRYLVNGEQHWANASDPQIPSALFPAVAGVDSLHNFPRNAMSRVLGAFSRDRTTGQMQPVEPLYTLPSGCTESASSSNPCYYGVSPYDFATIYDVLPLWNAGINGKGETIAIVGETNINIQDVRDFRTLFDLPANDPQIILNGPDPGIVADEVEANLDLQWSGAVAPQATIKFVASASTETTLGVDLSAVYIVENNLAPVMSESYGLCELALGTTGNQFYNALWQQAAAQGITVMIAAGDNGSAGCDNFNAASPAPALYGLQVSGFASTPYNVAVGGTDFNDFLNPAQYWNVTNNATTQESAKGYIPEVPWNATCTNPIFGSIGYSTNAETNCNDSRVTPYFDVPVGGSGGASACTTSDGQTTTSCSGGYPKPSWQSGTGVPNDGKRDIPDVSLFASSGFLSSFYMMCMADALPGPCSLSPNYYFLAVGGTSASSPAFAGVMALVNQKTGERQGNANYILYKLAAQQPTAFHDVTTGSNVMPCVRGTPNCTTSIAGDAYGVLTGYSATAGYDRATGLGSVDVNNLVTKWTSVALLPSTTTLSGVTPTTLTHGQAVSFKVSVAPKSGSGTPTGLVSLEGSPTSSTSGIAGFNLTNGSVSSSTEMLPGGTYSIIAHYPGDSTYAASDSSPVSVTVSKENSSPQPFLVTFDSNNHILNGDTNTAMYGSPYILRVNIDNAAGKLCAPVSTTGATACPTGTVSLTNNGTTLDAGTYTVNNYGYAEDWTVQLPGGTDSIGASYSGDTSFNTSTSTTAIVITPATTTTGTPNTYGIVALQAGNITVTVNTFSSGVGPTGTVTFFANGKVLPGSTSYSPTSGGSGNSASLYATLSYDPTAFPTPGSYSISATYSGDSNYASSSSPTTYISIKYAPPIVYPTPTSQIVNYGSMASISALVSSGNTSTYPSGTVSLTDANTGVMLAGPIGCTNAINTNGYYACQAAGSFTVTSGDPVSVNYSGDANYPDSNATAIIQMPDFYLNNPGPVSVIAGQAQTATIGVASLYGFGGTVTNFTCSGLPAETTCSFNPAQITASANANPTTLTITTTALGQSHARPTTGLQSKNWELKGPAILLGACLFGLPLLGRRRHIPITFFLIAVLIMLPSCGGSSSGGGGGSSNPVPAITTLSPAQVAAGSQINSLMVTGTGFISSSSVTFNGSPRSANYLGATQITLFLNNTDAGTIGSYPVVVTNPAPGGGPSNSVNFGVVSGTPTGTFSVTVTASSGALTHSQTFQLTVQ